MMIFEITKVANGICFLNATHATGKIGPNGNSIYLAKNGLFEEERLNDVKRTEANSVRELLGWLSKNHKFYVKTNGKIKITSELKYEKKLQNS